ncbi:hypothetical protein HXX76_013950 [Chlamydomonas incerta]|uniref:Uncharacterized protein n=1 Tax=Chlamydomonas incerta TaxID=51695 RepID=A0A835SDC5_CHLIN|nr:hypothetical protein HXX76_013950 [Chlamydomonas incerta]|eukprot:KAG2425197.1 hypothetical protein HXX76_013950 [Chlamydomonas incerta]
METDTAHKYAGETRTIPHGSASQLKKLTPELRQRLLCLAATSGDGPSLDAALAHCGCSLKTHVLAAAARAGHTAACKRLLAEGCESGVEAACEAAAAGHLSLCSLLWSKRCQDYTFCGDVDDDAYYASLDVVYVAEGACVGGHAAVLQWLETNARLFHEYELPDQEERWAVIDADLAAAAARSGRVSMMHELPDKLPPLDDDDEGGSWPRRLLCDVALGCPLPVFRDLAEQWRQLEPPQPGAPAAPTAAEDGCALLMHALGSRTPDWQEKVELVLARRPEYLALLTGEQDDLPEVDLSLIDCAAAQPDFEQRLRYLLSDKGAGAAALRAAAGAAAGAGDVAALRFLLDECGARLSDSGICEAAAHRQHAVLEFLRGRGQLPGCRAAELSAWTCPGNGRTLDPSAAPACVLAAAAWVSADGTARASSPAANQVRGFWSRVFERAARQGADLAALRYLHEQLGAEVQLQPIAEAGSVEQLEWALGVVVSGAGAAAAQGPVPAAQHLLLAALEAGNPAAASHLRACGLAPVLPTAGQVISLFQKDKPEAGFFVAVRWLVQQWRAARQRAAAAGRAAAGGRVAGEAAVGRADAQWDQLLDEVGLDGRLAGRFSENQWDWLKAAFLASPVLPHATPSSTAARIIGFTRPTGREATGKPDKREQEPAASAGAEGSGHKAEPARGGGAGAGAQGGACAERERDWEREEEWERRQDVMCARRMVVEGVARRFRHELEMEERRRDDAYDEVRAAAQSPMFDSDDDRGCDHNYNDYDGGPWDWL